MTSEAAARRVIAAIPERVIAGNRMTHSPANRELYRAGTTSRELAAHIGMSENHISDVFTGRRFVTPRIREGLVELTSEAAARRVIAAIPDRAAAVREALVELRTRRQLGGVIAGLPQWVLAAIPERDLEPIEA